MSQLISEIEILNHIEKIESLIDNIHQDQPTIKIEIKYINSDGKNNTFKQELKLSEWDVYPAQIPFRFYKNKNGESIKKNGCELIIRQLRCIKKIGENKDWISDLDRMDSSEIDINDEYVKVYDFLHIENISQ